VVIFVPFNVMPGLEDLAWHKSKIPILMLLALDQDNANGHSDLVIDNLLIMLKLLE
jgi:hypothetical protein